MIISMVCWGSWPNFLKGLPGWRLEYFYFDYSLGFVLAVVVFGMTLGSTGADGEPAFFSRLWNASHHEILLALVGGFLWNLGNILLLNSIMMAGLAVAFPVAAVPAIVIGIGTSYYLQPIGNPLVLTLSVVLLLVAGQVTAAAYRRLNPSTGSGKRKGIGTALASGLLIGTFPPFVTAAMSGARALDSYTVSMTFMLGALVASVILLPLFIKYPLIGEAGTLSGYLDGKAATHALGLLAGFVWCGGTVFNFISAGMVGIAISVGIGSGAPAVGALWGILVWKEFKGSSTGARMLIGLAVALYVVGVTSMAVAYTAR